MGRLPRTIPAAVVQELREALATAGLTLGPLKEGSRITHTVQHDGATWEITYLGAAMAWRVTGPGREHGVGALTEDVAHYITTPAGQETPDDRTETPTEPPASYRGVPVPGWIADSWHTIAATAWRDGVDAALTAVALGG